MVQFEYKVVGLNAFTYPGSEHIKADVLEQAINQQAANGWEYQNSIFCPSVQSGDYQYFARVNLVFRRAKS